METSNCHDYSQSVQVVYIGNSIGNGLFATKDFKKGDTIFEEDPLVSCQFSWNKAYGYLACDSCMRPLETAEENVRRLTKNENLILPYHNSSKFMNPHINCDFCRVSYCSEICKKKAWDQHHQILCLRSPTRDANHPLVILEETWKKIHYPPETASIMLLARIFATVQQSSNKEETIAKFMQFCHRTRNEEQEATHKLLGKEFNSQLDILRNLLEAAIGGQDVKQWLTSEGFQSLMALVGTNGQGIGTSPLSQWVKDVTNLEGLTDDEKCHLDQVIEDLYEQLDDVVGSFLDNEGSGLYALQSKCNHSCQPNAETCFPHHNFRLVMKALSDIKKGEEICISYINECFLDRSRYSRQKYLRENYIFKCQCSRCLLEADDPDETSEEEMDDSCEESE